MDGSLFGYSTEDFMEEAAELLGKAENILSSMEEAGHDPEKINALFRAIHSLKGSAAYAGLGDVNNFSHLYESFLGDLRNNRYEMDGGVQKLLVRSRDYLEDLVFNPNAAPLPEIDESLSDAKERITRLLSSRAEDTPPPEASELEAATQVPVVETAATPEPEEPQEEIEPTVSNPVEMGENDIIKVTLTKGMKAFAACLKKSTPDLKMLEKVMKKLEETLLWAFGEDAEEAVREMKGMNDMMTSGIGPEELMRLRESFNALAQSIRRLLLSLAPRVTPAPVAAPPLPANAVEAAPASVPPPPLADTAPAAPAEESGSGDGRSTEGIRGASEDDIVKITVTKSLESISRLLDEERPEGRQFAKMIRRLSDINSWAFAQDEDAARLLASMEQALKSPYSEAVAEELRAKNSALSSLFARLLGEKGLVESYITEEKPETPRQLTEAPRQLLKRRGATPAAGEGSSLRIKSADLESLMDTVGNMHGGDIKEMERLQAQTLQLRMVPVGDLFGRFRKVVRDIAEQIGKDIDIHISGESVQLDKFIADRLQEPLLHLVRNAAGHGIEEREEREAAGKGIGIIGLKAYQEGGQMIIEVSDDGRGISLETIRRKGLEKGFIREEEKLSDKEVLNLIFRPGFSTKERIDGLSGRGVGMDVVKDAISAVQGTVAIETEEKKGTTFRLVLPLTLAIVNALILKEGESRIALSAASVDRILNIDEEEIRKSSFMDRGTLCVDLKDEGEVLPLVRFDSLLGGRGRTGRKCIVIADSGMRQKVAMVVDSAVGRRSLTVKPLDRFARNRFFSSAAIMDDGLVMILNAPSLMEA